MRILIMKWCHLTISEVMIDLLFRLDCHTNIFTVTNCAGKGYRTGLEYIVVYASLNKYEMIFCVTYCEKKEDDPLWVEKRPPSPLK